MVILGALPKDASHARAPHHWLEDLYWHRISSGGSEFCWAREDALRIFLRYARGRCEFETFDHLRTLCHQQRQLQVHAGPIALAAGEMILQARDGLSAEEWWDYGRHMLSLDGLGMVKLTQPAQIDPWGQVPAALEHPEVRAATCGFAWPNPLSKAWELIQVHNMYTAAINMFEDLICDLALELQPDHGWIGVATRIADCNHWGPEATDLRARVEHHREERGEPCDPRRQVRQDYGAPVMVPPEVARYKPPRHDAPVAEPFGYA